MSITFGPTVPGSNGSTTCLPVLLSVSVTFSLVFAAGLAVELFAFMERIPGSPVVQCNKHRTGPLYYQMPGIKDLCEQPPFPRYRPAGQGFPRVPAQPSLRRSGARSCRPQAPRGAA